MKTAIEIMQDNLTYFYNEVKHLDEKIEDKKTELRFLTSKEAHLKKIIIDRIEDININKRKIQARIFDHKASLERMTRHTD